MILLARLFDLDCFVLFVVGNMLILLEIVNVRFHQHVQYCYHIICWFSKGIIKHLYRFFSWFLILLIELRPRPSTCGIVLPDCLKIMPQLGSAILL